MPWVCRYSRDVARIADSGDSPCELKKDGLLLCEGLAIEITSHTKSDACDNEQVFVGGFEDYETGFARKASAYMVGIEFRFDQGPDVALDPNDVSLVRPDGRREPPICIVEFPRRNRVGFKESTIRCDPSGEHDVEFVMKAHRESGGPEESRVIGPLEALELSSGEMVIFAFRGRAESGQGLSLDLGEVRRDGAPILLPVLKFEVKHGSYPTVITTGGN
jgi:hypothetical protein